MNRTVLSLFLITALAIAACTRTSDSCDDLAGTITHSSIEITGIESAAAFEQNTTSNAITAIDPLIGTDFSNLTIEIKLSWIEEQHRFRMNNTFIYSLLDWFISPVAACSLIPYYEEYQPTVSAVRIYSDSDLNEDFTAGNDLTQLFTVTGILPESLLYYEDTNNASLVSARAYSLAAARTDSELTTTPITPRAHIFTIMISLDNGQAYEIRTPEVLLH